MKATLQRGLKLRFCYRVPTNKTVLHLYSIAYSFVAEKRRRIANGELHLDIVTQCDAIRYSLFAIFVPAVRSN
jgi:hypothetical protein